MLFAVRGWRFAVRGWQFAISNSLLAVRCWQFAVYYLKSIVQNLMKCSGIIILSTEGTNH